MRVMVKYGAGIDVHKKNVVVCCRRVEKEEVWLQPENKNYQPIKITQENDFVIWGIVTNVIKKV